MIQQATVMDASVAGEDADNVYLQEFFAHGRPGTPGPGGYEAWLRAPGGPSAYERRVAGVRRYAFGIPNRAALQAIARHAPIVELGAGTGYWAYLLRNRGVQIVAYDLVPPDQAPNPYRFQPRLWTDVRPGGVEVLDQHADHALFLCWPGYRDTFAEEALARFAGEVLIYIGEGRGGNTANAAFFDRLHRDWILAEHVAIPRWAGAHDRMGIYYRGHPL